MKKILIVGFLVAGLLIEAEPTWAKKSIFWFTAPVCQLSHGVSSPCMYDEELCHYCDTSLGVGAGHGQTGNISFILSLKLLEMPHTISYTSETIEQTEEYQIYNLKDIFWPAHFYGGLLEVIVNSNLEIWPPTLNIAPTGKDLHILPITVKPGRK